jgi:N utilization substance protein B
VPATAQTPGDYVPPVQRDQVRPDGTVARYVKTVPAQAQLRGSARTKARKRALDILFEADLRGVDALQVLAGHTERDAPPVRPLTSTIVEGVALRQAEIDQVIAECLASDWTLDRMPRVDRCLARIAVWEISAPEAQPEVAVQQAVLLAQELSTEESAAFINGVLAKVLARHSAGTV